MFITFHKTAKLISIIRGPNIFGPLFDKILRDLGHSTPEKKIKNSNITSNLNPRPVKKKKKSPKNNYTTIPLCKIKYNKHYTHNYVHIYNSGIDFKANI